MLVVFYQLYIPQCIYFYQAVHQYLKIRVGLYIPQCIYFYTEFYLDEKDGERFTFHNVSISTLYGMYTINILQDFTFHNVSISTSHLSHRKEQTTALHSTMYLFLLDNRVTLTKVYVFTFHNVSISTMTPTE